MIFRRREKLSGPSVFDKFSRVPDYMKESGIVGNLLACARLCVTIKIVYLELNSTIRSSTTPLEIGSSELQGTSSSRASGSSESALATDSLCCCPPESERFFLIQEPVCGKCKKGCYGERDNPGENDLQ